MNEFENSDWTNDTPDGWAIGPKSELLNPVEGGTIQLKDLQKGGEPIRLGIQSGPNANITIDGISIHRIYRFWGRTWRVPLWRDYIRRLFKRVDIKLKTKRQYKISYNCFTIHENE